jgi:hypothetical protein
MGIQESDVAPVLTDPRERATAGLDCHHAQGNLNDLALYPTHSASVRRE